MRILLDTHVLLWYLEGNDELKRPQRELIIRPDNEIFVSVVSLWEIAIKMSIGKVRITRTMADILKQLNLQSLELLQIAPGHILQVASLPFHHRDPFDRMLVAQAKVEFLPIITADGEFSAYGIKVL